MGFKLVKTLPAVEWPVDIHEPKDGGETESHRITVTFKQLREDELNAAYNKQTKGQFLRDVITNISGVLDEDGSPIAYSDELKEQLLTVPWARDAVFDAYQGMIVGIAEKN